MSNPDEMLKEIFTADELLDMRSAVCIQYMSATNYTDGLSDGQAKEIWQKVKDSLGSVLQKVDSAIN